MLLSVVLPTHQQAHRMRHTLAGIRTLQATLPYPIEVLVADAHSTDGTPDMAEDAGLRVLRLETHGVGSAIRAGMLAARGVYRMLIEGDWTLPPEQLQLLLPPALTGADVAVASRHVPGAVRINEPLSSYLASRAFSRVVRALVLPDFADTQLGYKCFRAEAARALFSRCRETGAAVHVESLALARVFGLHIAEVPVDWTFSPRQALPPLREGPALLAAVARVRARLTAGRYAPLQISNPTHPRTPTWSL